MPDLEALATQIGADLAALVQPMLDRLEADLTARLEAASVREALIDRGGGLVLILGDGSARNLGAVIGRDGVDGAAGHDGVDGAAGQAGADGRDGRDGIDGKDGAPGFGFDDLTVEMDDDGRTVVLTFVRGDLRKVFEFSLPAMLYRGVFVPDRAYVPGDVVTFGGSIWVCGVPTSARPGEGESAWTLAVKRGRDGKDFAGPPLKVAS